MRFSPLLLLWALSFALIFVAGTTTARAEPALSVPVSRAQFQVGRWWMWTYSQLDRPTGAWSPTYYERYAVVAEKGDTITLDMSSDDHLPIVKPAHHRIVIDFSDCVAAATIPGRRNFTVHFYTTSLGPGWQLVSDAHPGLVFTEKFNCQMPLGASQMAAGSFVTNDHVAPTFSFRGRESFYFLNEPGLEGVAASKSFPPGDYKFEYSASGF